MIIASVFLLLSQTASAHPLDISSTTFTVNGMRIEAITYFHPSEVEATIGKSGISMRSLTYGDYYKYSQHLYDYLSEKVSVTDSTGKSCKIGNFSTQDLGVDEIFTKGFPISYSITCESSLDKFGYGVDIYTELPLQTNRVLMYDGKTGSPVSYKVLTSKISNASFSIDAPKKLPDADGDGLPDEEEALYRTNPNAQDTDGDFYSDYEEVMLGWNPISKSLSPGQSERRAPLETPFELPTGINQHTTSSTGSTTKSATGAAMDNTSLGNSSAPSSPSALVNAKSFEIFGTVLRYVEQIRKWAGMEALFPALLLLFLLGGLHALGPGHSKGFMAGYILSERVGFWKSIAYAAIFTSIHLADIIIMTLVAKFAFAQFDTAAYFSQIQRYSAALLVVVALSFLVRSLWKYFRKVPVSQASPSGGLWMAFFAGLAPCTFAWSIVLVLFAIGRLDLAIPFVLSFGMWVFAALATVAIIVYRVREKALGWGKNVALVLPIFSSLLLVILSGILTYRVFL